MKLISGILAAAALMVAGAAHAQPECHPEANVAPMVAMPEKDAAYREGLPPAFLLALSPRSFPLQSIKSIDEPCTRGTFEAGGATYRVYGGFGDMPPRYALGPDPKKVAYIASGPPPALALKWQQAGGKGGLSFRTGGIKILAITNGDMREVYALFEDIPGDAQLIDAFREALEGRLPLIATYDASRGTTKLAEQ